MTFRWAIIDLETTGLHILHDKIIEIAVIVFTEKGIEQRWHNLINPERSLPSMIISLTGISNEMLTAAPLFSDISKELMQLLDGCILVAHNARFDFGFLKNAFKNNGMTLKIPVLCTIKLFKKLYPELPKFNLDYLSTFFSVSTPIKHRANEDVQKLFNLLNIAFTEWGLPKILESAKLCYQKISSLPSRLKTDMTSIPDTSGVYLFYGADDCIPLYIGKSVSLKQRIMSHFHADHSHAKEFSMTQQIERIEIIPTAGELSALLLESRLIKEKMPIYNRRLRRKKITVAFQLKEKEGYLHVEIIRESSDKEDLDGLYGSYRSLTAAKNTLAHMVKEHQLCWKLCGLEKTKGACFSYQLRKCHGACIGQEKPEAYNTRLQHAFTGLKKAIWPFTGSIAIKEKCLINNLTEYMIFNQWRHIRTVDREKDLYTPTKPFSFYDYDAYQILVNYLHQKVKAGQLISLD